VESQRVRDPKRCNKHMNLKQFFDDDDAVSPVIGVILMVAITVILAAVIATFVLGLGEQVSQTSPNTSFSFDYEEGNAADSWTSTTNSDGDALLTITHSGGPNIDADQLGVTGSDYDPGNSGDTYTDFSTADNSVSWNSGKMSAGDSISIRIDSDDRINTVWENDEGSESAILQTFKGPDA